ncbi:MAG TPA: heavy metal-binding domain-containing protein, partial [Chitinophagaceae bacterium]|nr:heavy metal-binding domain-containing protein [Chitinophagaceae bacterium]
MTIKFNSSYWRRCLVLVLVVLMYGCNSNPPKTNQPAIVVKQLYRCPMHHEIVRDKPGTCPICGMDLVAFSGNEKAVTEVSLNTLLRPAN